MPRRLPRMLCSPCRLFHILTPLSTSEHTYSHHAHPRSFSSSPIKHAHTTLIPLHTLSFAFSRANRFRKNARLSHYRPATWAAPGECQQGGHMTRAGTDAAERVPRRARPGWVTSGQVGWLAGWVAGWVAGCCWVSSAPTHEAARAPPRSAQCAWKPSALRHCVAHHAAVPRPAPPRPEQLGSLLLGPSPPATAPPAVAPPATCPAEPHMLLPPFSARCAVGATAGATATAGAAAATATATATAAVTELVLHVRDQSAPLQLGVDEAYDIQVGCEDVVQAVTLPNCPTAQPPNRPTASLLNCSCAGARRRLRPHPRRHPGACACVPADGRVRMHTGRKHTGLWSRKLVGAWCRELCVHL